MVEIAQLITQFPGLRALVEKFPAIYELQPLMDKKIAQIDLKDLNLVKRVFNGNRELTQADVDYIKQISACTSADELADLYRSPEAAKRIIQFFIKPSGDVESTEEAIEPIHPTYSY